ncbi:hypothetical protein ZWY2020_034642 [Hordeum vulgare]|nr:hypothetical protein ZWY2020_034642 [Hordeum vulgare]
MQCLVAPLLGNATDQDVLDENLGKLRKVLEEYEARLSASKYLAGQSVSLADLSHFPMMRYHGDRVRGAGRGAPHVKAWWRSSRRGRRPGG